MSFRCKRNILLSDRVDEIIYQNDENIFIRV